MCFLCQRFRQTQIQNNLHVIVAFLNFSRKGGHEQKTFDTFSERNLRFQVPQT